MKILIGADVVATERNIEYFKSGDVVELVGEDLYALIRSSDALFFNMEVPFTNGWTPIKKAGTPRANLRMDETAIKGIKALNPTFVTIANNHIMDHGIEGLHRTQEILSNASIHYGGVGENVAEASKAHFITVKNRTIGIYCCAEHEFSIATRSMPGANPFDPLESLDHIENAKKNCDYLIVLYHGGREYYRYPSPELQHRFRRMADKGADLVIAQHTHCIGCYEKWKDSTLVYGQGNFIFDHGEDEYWNSGMLVELEISEASEDGDVNICFIPFIKTDGRIRKANEKESVALLGGFHKRSEEVKNTRIVEERYAEYAFHILPKLLRVYHGNSLPFRTIYKVARIFGNDNFIYKIYGEGKLLSLLNYLECEAHSEVAVKGIKSRLFSVGSDNNRGKTEVK